MLFKFESTALNSGVTPDKLRNLSRISISISTSLTKYFLSKRESVLNRFFNRNSFMRDFMSNFSYSRCAL